MSDLSAPAPRASMPQSAWPTHPGLVVFYMLSLVRTFDASRLGCIQLVTGGSVLRAFQMPVTADGIRRTEPRARSEGDRLWI